MGYTEPVCAFAPLLLEEMIKITIVPRPPISYRWLVSILRCMLPVSASTYGLIAGERRIANQYCKEKMRKLMGYTEPVCAIAHPHIHVYTRASMHTRSF